MITQRWEWHAGSDEHAASYVLRRAVIGRDAAHGAVPSAAADKLIDELAEGTSMEKILRSG